MALVTEKPEGSRLDPRVDRRTTGGASVPVRVGSRSQGDAIDADHCTGVGPVPGGGPVVRVTTLRAPHQGGAILLAYDAGPAADRNVIDFVEGGAP